MNFRATRSADQPAFYPIDDRRSSYTAPESIRAWNLPHREQDIVHGEQEEPARAQ